jgi:hypothetical protein
VEVDPEGCRIVVPGGDDAPPDVPDGTASQSKPFQSSKAIRPTGHLMTVNLYDTSKWSVTDRQPETGQLTPYVSLASSEHGWTVALLRTKSGLVSMDGEASKLNRQSNLFVQTRGLTK